MKYIILWPAIFLLQSPMKACAQERKSAKNKVDAPVQLTWQQYDSLAAAAIRKGDTAAAISYYEHAAAGNKKLRPTLDKLRKKYASDGSSFYLKEY